MRTLVALGRAGGGDGAAGAGIRAARRALPRLGDRAAGEHVRDLALRAAAGGAPRSRRDGRGAGGEPAGRAREAGLARDPRREPRQGQRRPHPDRAARACSRSRPRAIPGRCAWRACTARRSRRRRPQRKAIERVTGLEVEPLIVFSRAWVDGRWRAARACGWCRRGCSSAYLQSVPPERSRASRSRGRCSSRWRAALRSATYGRASAHVSSGAAGRGRGGSLVG